MSPARAAGTSSKAQPATRAVRMSDMGAPSKAPVSIHGMAAGCISSRAAPMPRHLRVERLVGDMADAEQLVRGSSPSSAQAVPSSRQ